jgi:CRP-like cAMP-binding protein
MSVVFTTKGVILNKLFNTIKDNILFQGIAFSDFEKMLTCLSAKTINYKKDEVILMAGDSVNYVGLVLSGSLLVIKEDIDGRVMLFSEYEAPETFGVIFSCAAIDHSPVTVKASNNAEILFVDYKKIITSCAATCPCHVKLIENMLKLIAVRALTLTQKIEILSKRTTRETLLTFFDMQKSMAKKFTIPYNREEMAQYLCVDRSALSNELSKMRKEGLIDFSKNTFELLMHETS